MDVTQIIIRPYQQPDEQQVIALWHRCNLVVPWNDPKQDIARKLQIQPHLFLIGEKDDLVIASIMAGYEGHRGWLNYLAVCPDHQRKGFGRRMVEAAESELRRVGCPKINLQIRSSNRAVIDFYRSLGFGIDEVVSMGKRL
jgi:ribosomal protein S18 acetylase RimI-like enzyme